eukprot:859755-Ditylum_brightwellii.AAC.1
MRQDEPVSLAKCIKRYAMESSRWDGTFNVWTTKVLKGNARAISGYIESGKSIRHSELEGQRCQGETDS